MSAAAERFFDEVCQRPAMMGTPSEVEGCLWTCMAIWSLERLSPQKNYVHEAVSSVRQQIPDLHDQAGMRFCDLGKDPFDYEPVVRNMRTAFDLLKAQAG